LFQPGKQRPFVPNGSLELYRLANGHLGPGNLHHRDGIGEDNRVLNLVTAANQVIDGLEIRRGRLAKVVGVEPVIARLGLVRCECGGVNGFVDARVQGFEFYE